MAPAMSHHDGVRCCPALKENSNKKYIVKIISIPASQVQLDAFLLTGAYREPSAALEYFRELSEDVEKEAAALKNLAKLEGFLAYEHGDLGYEIYLLGSYKRSLEKYLRRNTMTHLGAVNLGIDICDALSAARRAGWIYADLKPSNIFISENNEYRIGDLGLLPLDGLELASLPGKYRSAYTAPELENELLSPNTTMDTYALGLILYQLYNNGLLPQVPHPTEDLPAAPANADEELSQIILRALDPDPAQRWENPSQMGQSLVAYMQRNRVNNEPIFTPPEQEESAQSISAPEVSAPAEETPELPAPAEEIPEALPPEEPLSPDADPLPEDNCSPASESAPESDDILAQADAIIAGQHPALSENPAEDVQSDGDTVAEEPDLNSDMPELVQENPVPEAAPEQTSPVKPVIPDSEQDLTARHRRNRRKVILIPLLIGILLAALGVGALWYYKEVYLLRVDSLSVSGSENQLSVLLDTSIEDQLLQVTCTDTDGNVLTSPVVQGEALFQDRAPDMTYRIQVQVEGFHQLDGSTTHEYVTPALTRVSNFTAFTGAEDGSVVLNFDVEGPDSEEWIVSYETEDESCLSRRFSGHTVTVTGLTLGKTYRIQVTPVNDLYMAEEAALEFTASAIVIAENIRIAAQENNVLTVAWDAPKDSEVSGWDVYCYSIDGYESRLTTTECNVSFSDILPECAYTVEIKAQGMTQPARASISANPIRVTSVDVSPVGNTALKVQWEFQGDAPSTGWLLLYTIDGNGKQQVVQCKDNSGIIEVRVPDAEYEVTIQSADGRTVFDGSSRYTAPSAQRYTNKEQCLYARENAHLLFVDLLKTPEKANWNHRDVHKSQFTSSFLVGDPISVHLYYMDNFYIRHENIQLLYVIRDAEGKVISDCIAMENRDWRDGLWNGPDYHYCCLNLPHVPSVPGEYTFNLYFNGQLIANEDFTIQE